MNHTPNQPDATHPPDAGPYANLTGQQIRKRCRDGLFTGPTTGAAFGYAQANLVILAREFAIDFETFCRLNPKPCPLIEVTAPGSPEPIRSARGADLRTDLPRYRVYRDGTFIEQCASILHHWPDSTPEHTAIDLVAFLLGCSFTFESALIHAGIPVRHIEQRCNVPMYRTNVPCVPSQRFHGPLVVSMRPVAPQNLQMVCELTASLPDAHGEPVHIGDPSAIGISDLARPDYGDPVTILPEEVPVFWACGVTPMEAIRNSRPPLAITHEPGHMFVTDLRS